MSITARFHALDLSSRFQPIFGVAGRRAIGYEALLTAREDDGQPIPPAALFALAGVRGETVYLDWIARALHLRNFADVDAGEGTRLFINVSPLTALDDLRLPSVFPAVIETFGVDPARIVIEILEDPVADEARLGEAVACYRRLGCAIALDDFDGRIGCGERLARLRPEVVKVARELVVAAGADAGSRRLLCETVATIHAFGAAAVLEGVETRAEAQAALESRADCVQGFYFARPSERGTDQEGARRLAELTVDQAREPRRAPPRGTPPARAFGKAS